MSNLSHSESIIIDRRAEDLYDMVSDVTRIGEWSPVCKACWWDKGNAARVGDWFTGRNVLPERTWETRSEVVVADRGREFAFIVGGRYGRRCRLRLSGVVLRPVNQSPARAELPSSHQQALQTGLHSPMRVTSETMS